MITLQIKKKNKIYFAGDFHLGKPDKESSLSREKKILNKSVSFVTLQETPLVLKKQ